MSSPFSPVFLLTLARLPPDAQAALVAALQKRVRDAELYELLVLLLGPTGLSRLYLRDGNGWAVRLFVGLSFLTLLYTGVALVSTPVLLGSAAFLALILALWLHDYRTRERQVQAYHARLEARVLRRLVP